MAATDDRNLVDDDEPLEGELESQEKTGFAAKRFIVLGAAGLLLLAAAGAGGYFLFMRSGGTPEQSRAEANAAAGDIVFYDLPEMLVNLNTGGRKASYLKVKVALEVSDPADVAELDAKMPRVVDHFQVYLRDMRLEDLEGSAGMYRMKEELLRRVNASVAPTVVNDVLFRELIVQ